MERDAVLGKIVGVTLAAGAAFGVDVSTMSHAEAPPQNPNVYSNPTVIKVGEEFKINPPFKIEISSFPTANPIIEVGQESEEVSQNNDSIMAPEVLGSWLGVATWYSREGCVGCSEGLLMANGEPLRDDQMTVAFNKAPLGSILRITNLANGESVEVEVTDTGGFEQIGDGRIVDVTPIVRDSLGFVDMAQVKVDLMSLPQE